MEFIFYGSNKIAYQGLPTKLIILNTMETNKSIFKVIKALLIKTFLSIISVIKKSWGEYIGTISKSIFKKPIPIILKLILTKLIKKKPLLFNTWGDIMNKAKKRFAKKIELSLLQSSAFISKIQWIIKNKVTKLTKEFENDIVIALIILLIFTRMLRIMIDNINDIIYNNLEAIIKLKSWFDKINNPKQIEKVRNVLEFLEGAG